MLLIFDHPQMESSQWPQFRLIPQSHRVRKIAHLLNWTQMGFIKVMQLMVIISKVLLCRVMVIVRLIISLENNWRKQSLMKGLLSQTASGHRLIGLCNKISFQDQYQVDKMITKLIKHKIIEDIKLGKNNSINHQLNFQFNH